MSSVRRVFYIRSQLYLENKALFYGGRRVSELYISHLSKKLLSVFFLEVGFKLTVQESISIHRSNRLQISVFPGINLLKRKPFLDNEIYYTLFFFIRTLFFRPRLHILIFLPILG